MSVLSDYYQVRAWLDLAQAQPNTLNRPVKNEEFDVLSSNAFRTGILVQNDSDVVVYLHYADEIDTDEYSLALDPGQAYHLEDAGFYRCPQGPIVGLADQADDDGVLQVTEWSIQRRFRPPIRQLLSDVEEELQQ
jgi:hypothetical protein